MTTTLSPVTTCPECKFVVLPEHPRCLCNLGHLVPDRPATKPPLDVVTLVMRAQDDLCALWAEIRRAILAQQTGDRRLRNKRVAEAQRLQGRLTQSVAAIGGAFIPADDEPAQTDETAPEAICEALRPPGEPLVPTTAAKAADQRGLRFGQCAHCGGSLTSDHRCPRFPCGHDAHESDPPIFPHETPPTTTHEFYAEPPLMDAAVDEVLLQWLQGSRRGPGCGSKGVEVRGDV